MNNLCKEKGESAMNHVHCCIGDLMIGLRWIPPCSLIVIFFQGLNVITPKYALKIVPTSKKNLIASSRLMFSCLRGLLAAPTLIGAKNTNPKLSEPT